MKLFYTNQDKVNRCRLCNNAGATTGIRLHYKMTHEEKVVVVRNNDSFAGSKCRNDLSIYFDHEYSLLVKEKVNAHVRLVNNKKIKNLKHEKLEELRLTKNLRQKQRTCNDQMKELSMS